MSEKIPYSKRGSKLQLLQISSLSILNYVDMGSESLVLGYGIWLILLNGMMYVGIPASVIVVVRKF